MEQSNNHTNHKNILVVNDNGYMARTIGLAVLMGSICKHCDSNGNTSCRTN